MSKLETNTIDTLSGTSNLTIGSTNSSTVTFENGSCTGHMYPAFEVFRNSDQSISDNTNTKIQFNSVEFDEGGYYDDTTNYRYTPLIAGKYFFYAQCMADAIGSSDLNRVELFIRKNGSNVKSSSFMMPTYRLRQATPFIAIQIAMNGSTDYMEVFAKIDDNSGSPNLESGVRSCAFGGYRIGA